MTEEIRFNFKKRRPRSVSHYSSAEEGRISNFSSGDQVLSDSTCGFRI